MMVRIAGVGLVTVGLFRLLVGAAFGRHACRTVFNRRPTALLSTWLSPLLRVTRPLELAWRLLTAPLRVAGPDVVLLGEVRCGTTTLASLLRSDLGMQGPFTPWDVPLANGKESFYFAGHYFGCVAPRLYRLCFPFIWAHWLDRVVRRQLHLPPPLLFDGCASHLSAPWAPELMQRLQREEMGGRPMVFVVCVREPVSQHLSWWRLEQGSMAFAASLGFGADWHPPPTRYGYPPATFAEAIELSRSDVVSRMWSDAELELASGCWLPDWAAPFPNGQLSAFDRFGHFADNLQRWFERFGRDAFVIVSLEQLASQPDLVLDRIVAKCEEVLGTTPRRAGSKVVAPVLNAAPLLADHLEPEPEFLRRLAADYRPINEQLFELLGEDLGWHADPKYWWYEGTAAGGHACSRAS